MMHGEKHTSTRLYKPFFHSIVGHPGPVKKSIDIFEYILVSMLKVYLDVF